MQAQDDQQMDHMNSILMTDLAYAYSWQSLKLGVTFILVGLHFWGFRSEVFLLEASSGPDCVASSSFSSRTGHPKTVLLCTPRSVSLLQSGLFGDKASPGSPLLLANCKSNQRMQCKVRRCLLVSANILACHFPSCAMWQASDME